jgi:hypothetical protein
MYFNRRNGKAAVAAWEKAVELDATLEEEFEPLIERARGLK